MACISTPTALLLGAGISGATGLFSGLLGSKASEDSAKIQANAANNATAATLAMFGVSRAGLTPFMGAGQGALGSLSRLIGLGPQMRKQGLIQAQGALQAARQALSSAKTPQEKQAAQAALTQAQKGFERAQAVKPGPGVGAAPLTARFNPTMKQLEATPGYKFTLQQGLESAQNGFAAQGLGQSGAAMKGGINYAEGLASTTYQQQFQNYLGQNQQIYNMLGGVSSQGENAAATAGSQALGFQSQANSLGLAGAGATASGIIGSAGAIAGGLNALGSSGSNAATLLALNNAGMFGSGKG